MEGVILIVGGIIILGLAGIGHSIDQLRNKLTEIYNHSLQYKEKK